MPFNIAEERNNPRDSSAVYATIEIGQIFYKNTRKYVNIELNKNIGHPI